MAKEEIPFPKRAAAVLSSYEKLTLEQKKLPKSKPEQFIHQIYAPKRYLYQNTLASEDFTI
jgi:hypothetical protein